MKKLSNILFALSIIGLLIGLSGVGNAMVCGFAIAMCAVTFALSFITLVVYKAETSN